MFRPPRRWAPAESTGRCRSVGTTFGTAPPEETSAHYGIATPALLDQQKVYGRQYGFPGIFLVPGNLSGQLDDFDPENAYVIPAIIRKFIEARKPSEGPVTARGTGSQTRESRYVGDAAHGTVDAWEQYDAAPPVNVGTGEEISIRELVRTIADTVGLSGM